MSSAERKGNAYAIQSLTVVLLGETIRARQALDREHRALEARLFRLFVRVPLAS
jgi:hypothetical protein